MNCQLWYCEGQGADELCCTFFVSGEAAGCDDLSVDRKSFAALSSSGFSNNFRTKALMWRMCPQSSWSSNDSVAGVFPCKS